MKKKFLTLRKSSRRSLTVVGVGDLALSLPLGAAAYASMGGI